MRRRHFLPLLAALLVARPLAASAQRSQGIPRVGVLLGASPSVDAKKLRVFIEALERLGYRESQTIRIEARYGEGRVDRIAAMARELVALKPAVIACVGRREAIALRAFTSTIPIVFMQGYNLLDMGLVETLARPGGNVTGFSQMSAELDAKRLELLHAIAPTHSRAAFLLNPSRTPNLRKRFAKAQAAAKMLGIHLRHLDATTPSELTAVLAAVDTASGEALLVLSDPLLTGIEQRRIIDFAAAHRLPTVFERSRAVARGALLSYGPDLRENPRLAAGYVDKILKGAKPANLPVQRPTKFELAINLKTAKALGLAVPRSLLARADVAIE